MKTIKIETLQDLENFINQPRPQEAVTVVISSPEAIIKLQQNPEIFPIVPSWQNPLIFGSHIFTPID